MLNSGILDVAIGLVFIFLLLSLICSAISEIIETLLKKRASDLEKGIREFLQDTDGTGLAKEIYNHPLVFGLYKGGYEPKKSSNLPSYIPSRNFALALMDTILPAGAGQVSGAAGATGPPPAAASSPPSGGTPPTPPAKPPADQGKVGEAAGATGSPTTTPISPGGETPPAPLKPLRDAVAGFPNEQVKKALLTLVDAAGNDVNKARENIEGWYDSSVERIAGWYKRRSQGIILVLGLAVAISVNVDTIAVARSLSYDAALRNSLVSAAQEYAKTPQGQAAKTPEARVKENLDIIRKHGLPIGWNLGEEQDERYVPALLQKEFPYLILSWAWALKFLGWFLTAMAISLGAPFWFDLLNKFMTARSTLKPAKPEEPKKA
jgi:hypothetical protein